MGLRTLQHLACRRSPVSPCGMHGRMSELHRTSLRAENISGLPQGPIHLPFRAFPGSSSTKGDFSLLLAPRER